MSIKNNFSQIKKQLLSPNNNAIIHNKYILYFVLFIALADLYFSTMLGDFVSVSIFILIGFLTSFFSKNMLIILFIALTVTNILKYGSHIRQEGFENEDTKEALTEEDYKLMKYPNEPEGKLETNEKKPKKKKGEEEEEEEEEEEHEEEKKHITSPSEIVGKLKQIINILQR